jgi:hypothetical protein
MVSTHALAMVRLFESLLEPAMHAHWRSPSLEWIALSHAHLHPRALDGAMWELLGECLVDVFGMYDIVQAYPDAKIAWFTLFAVIIDRMRAAYEKGVGEMRRPIGPRPICIMSTRRQYSAPQALDDEQMYRVSRVRRRAHARAHK